MGGSESLTLPPEGHTQRQLATIRHWLQSWGGTEVVAWTEQQDNGL